jgi:predicted HicB family RNase H-like nuclease
MQMPSNVLKHQGYYAEFGYDESADAFCGRILGIRDVIDFYGRDVDELKESFRASVAEYEDWCREEGIPPERPWSGKTTLRPTDEQHRRYVAAAALAHMSVNAWMLQVLDRESAAVERDQVISV